ncbi:MAG: hypothetical protein FWC86_05510 [Coriobacteriia bacterium]|nr:hypothetical protein [Coriobacteriia bacterium]
MNIKKRLEAHRKLLCKIRTSEQQLENLKEGMTTPVTSDPSRSAVQGGEKSDHLPITLHQIEIIQKELEGLYVLRDQEHDELWPVVNLLECSDESIMLKAKYFSLMSREEIADLLFGHKEDFNDRYRNYLQRVSNLHTIAIRKLNNHAENPAKKLASISCA